MEQIVLDSIRVQLLSDDIVRVERAHKKAFCNENTFFVPEREQYDNNKIEYTVDGNIIRFGSYELHIPENQRSLSDMVLYKDGKKVYSYKKLVNTGELPPLNKTPEVFALADTPRILIPEGGYSKDRNGQYKVTENVQDVYLLLCQKDAKKLRRLYVELTGRPELIRLSTLGGWNSKYYAYSEEEAKQLILDYEAHNVPLDVMVIDTDWRSCENGWGYDINKKLFPDMKRFIDFAHAHNVEIIFNDHPEPVEKTNVFRSNEIAYREKNLQALMDLGLDMWWYDRNWSTSLISPTENVRHETFGLYLFYDITKHFYQKQASNNDIYRRPVLMGNVVNIANGIYQGITDSASHRYSIQWTGDIGSGLDTLGVEVRNLVKAGANGVVYTNSDCGGHIGNPGKEDFVRWMQFGTLSPIYRPHCTNTVIRTREPWVFDQEALDIVREYNNLRYRLLPVIYKNAYNAYETGEPIFKAIGFEYPNDKKALSNMEEYMLGNDILVRPLSRTPAEFLEKKHYSAKVKATYFDGMEWKGEPIAHAEYDELNIQLYGVGPEESVPPYYFSAHFETEVCFDKDVELLVLSDDGCTVWVDGEKVLDDKTLHAATSFPLKLIKGGVSHKVVIDYFQAGGAAVISLMYQTPEKFELNDVYLPEGKWLFPFSGKCYQGGKSLNRSYELREMPLFIRCGALIPLAYEAKNTKEQRWDKLVLDYYPWEDAKDSGYIYEDDTETTAYILGEFRKTAYESYYSEDECAYVVKLGKSEGSFNGDRCFDSRSIAVKCHLLNGIVVRRVTVNDEDVRFRLASKNPEAFPLNTGRNSADSKTVWAEFEANVNNEYIIKLYL